MAQQAHQDLWHVHVLPRYSGDDLYRRDHETHWVEAAERAEWADRLRVRMT